MVISSDWRSVDFVLEASFTIFWSVAGSATLESQRCAVIRNSWPGDFSDFISTGMAFAPVADARVSRAAVRAYSGRALFFTIFWVTFSTMAGLPFSADLFRNRRYEPVASVASNEKPAFWASAARSCAEPGSPVSASALSTAFLREGSGVEARLRSDAAAGAYFRFPREAARMACWGIAALGRAATRASAARSVPMRVSTRAAGSLSLLSVSNSLTTGITFSPATYCNSCSRKSLTSASVARAIALLSNAELLSASLPPSRAAYFTKPLMA